MKFLSKRNITYIFYTFTGLLFGLLFPIIFILLDLRQLGEEVTIDSVRFIIDSQEIYGFSMITFPLLFALVFFSVAIVLKSKKDLRIANKLVLEEQKKSLISSKMALVGEMASGIAHEINNPLTVIHLKMRTFERRMKKNEGFPNRDELVEFLNSFKETLQRINSIVMTMKELSDNQRSSKVTQEDLLGIVTEAIEYNRYRAKEHNIDFHVDVDSCLKVYCKKTELSQVIVNLINNSIFELKTPKFKGRELFIKLRAEVTEGMVKLYVTDSGTGIPDEILVRIFDPYYTTKDTNSGTGLGLSLSKKIMNLNGGDLYYNEQAKHTEFVIEIPINNKRISE